jgi:plastocyanin
MSRPGAARGAWVVVLMMLMGSGRAAANTMHSASPSQNVATVGTADNFFDPEAVHVAVGARIQWTNRGQSNHTVTSDTRAFDSGDLPPGRAFVTTFNRPGAFLYFCKYHGSSGGHGMSGVVLVGDARLPSRSGHGAGPGREPVPSEPGNTLSVPEEFRTIQNAVDAADPGDLVLVSPGIYREGVKVTTPYITIRGRDRNSVILDGGFAIANGIHVIEADGVAVENMTARHYRLNGFQWTGVLGYRGAYLTAHNNGDYGLYAFDSRFGRFMNSYASGHPDAGFYIGQCHPCDAVVTQVVSERNGLGFSGTNAGGNMSIVNSVWRQNMGGIVPNTLDSERLAPQRDVHVAGNLVEDNNNVHAPANEYAYGALGTGIVVAGGVGNVVERNTVRNHRYFGIAIDPNADRNIWISQRNIVRGNTVLGSGLADLSLGGPAGRGNCFTANDFRSSLPPAIETLYGCGTTLQKLGGGDLGSTTLSLALFVRGKSGKFPHGDWRTQPVPPPQRTMPGDVTTAPVLALPGIEVPGRVKAARSYRLPLPNDRMEVNVLGVPLAAPTWWTLLLGIYGYVLPLVLFVTWITVAIWDLIRREDIRNSVRITWMVVIFAIPILGPILYYVSGRSPIPRSLRVMLLVGGLIVYAGVFVGALALGSRG